jgi:hypothetical protein
MQVLIELPMTIMNWLYSQAIFWTPLQWGAISMCSIWCAISGWRLTRFSHPGYPRWSALLRHAASVLILWPSFICVATVFVGCLVLFALSLNFGLLNAVWDLLRQRTHALEWGVAAGSLLGGLFYYHLIPGWEMPGKTAAAPDAVMTATGKYDPERFFRV